MLKKILIALVLTQLSLFADTSQGENLERQMWKIIKDKQWKELDNKLAPYFQLALFDGAFNKDQYIQRSKTLNPSDFKISNLKVTEGPGVYVITYDLEISETISGKALTSKATRLSTWQNNNGNWQWISHAVIIPSS